MKKFAIAFIIFASSLAAQVQLGKNVQIGAGATGVTEVDTNATSGISGGPITTTGTVACSQATASQFGCVKPDGTSITASGGVLSATGTGGTGVQYNPTTTAYFIISTSAIYDDNDGHSRTIGVPSSVTCVHTTTSTCTLVFPSSHGMSPAALNKSSAVDMTSLASWPNSPAGALQQSAQYGSFQVTTVPNGTTLTFTTPTALTYTCSPCTGNVFDASLWAIWEMASQPYYFGHGTVYGIETTTQSAAANLSTWLAGISGTPLYVIDQTGQNDFSIGRTPVQVETDHLTVWAAVHTAGGKVIQTTIIPAAYGLTGQGTKPGEVNEWYWENQGHTVTSLANGQYMDMYADTATAYLAAGSVSPDPAVNPIFGNVLNQVMSTQGSIKVQPPSNFSYSVSSIGGDSIRAQYIAVRQLGFYNNSGTWTQMYDWNPTTATGLSFNVPVSLTTLTGQACLGTNGSGTIQAGTCGSMTNPMTTLGDSLYGGASGTPTRLAGPTTSGHLFLYGWTPSGSAIAPTAYDFGANAGTWIKATSPIVATQNANDVTFSCPTCSVGSGTNVTVNGGSALGTANLNDTTPTAAANGLNVKFQTSTTNVSAYVPGDGVSTHFLNGTGAWSTPAGGGSGAWTNITSSLASSGGCGTNTGGVCTISGTTTTTVNFNTIPAHKRMQIVVYGESSVGTDQPSSAYLTANFNGDTTAGHYIVNGLVQNATSAATVNASTSTNLCVFGQIGASSTGQSIADIPFYADTVFPKSAFVSNSSNAGGFWQNLSCGWTQTSAITSIDINLTLSAHFIAGTKIMILVQD